MTGDDERAHYKWLEGKVAEFHTHTNHLVVALIDLLITKGVITESELDDLLNDKIVSKSDNKQTHKVYKAYKAYKELPNGQRIYKGQEGYDQFDSIEIRLLDD